VDLCGRESNLIEPIDNYQCTSGRDCQRIIVQIKPKLEPFRIVCLSAQCARYDGFEIVVGSREII
jgi:hypothetical protein